MMSLAVLIEVAMLIKKQRSLLLHYQVVLMWR